MTIIFSHEIKGHYLEYIHNIYEKCKDVDGEFIFYIPEQFNDIKGLVSWEEIPSIRFEYIPVEVYNLYMSKGIVGRALYICKLLQTKIKEYGASKVFCCSLITLLPYAPFMISYNVKISGIVYMVYLYRWKEFSIGQKIQNVLKYILMTLSPNINKVLILNDKKSAERLNKIYKTSKFSYIPDPYVPLKASNCMQNIRNKYGIEKSKVLFAHFGAMNSNKGTIEFLNSLVLLPDSIINLSHFFLAGKVDMGIKGEFYHLYNQIKDKVSITLIDEFCSYEFFASLCNDADCLVLPYKRTSQSSGLIGYASQFEKPVIAPDKGLLGNLVREYKLGVTISDLSPKSLICAYKIIIDKKYTAPNNDYCMDHSVSSFQEVIEVSI